MPRQVRNPCWGCGRLASTALTRPSVFGPILPPQRRNRTPDLTLLEIQARAVAHCGEPFSVSLLWRFFDRHEITFETKTAHAAEQQRSDVLEKRRRWFDGQLDLAHEARFH